MYRKANARKMTVKKKHMLVKKKIRRIPLRLIILYVLYAKKGRRCMVFVLIVLRKHMQNVKIC